MFCGCILFADDILSISASFIQLQLKLDLCIMFAIDDDMNFNHLKAYFIYFLFSEGINDRR